MATKSTRSSGTQHNARGVTQGNTLVGPQSGLPIDEIVDGDGVRRLAVDANINATIGSVNVDLDYEDDSVSIGDPNTNTTLKVNANGSIDANVEVNAADGDNIAISDGTDTLAINTDGSINVNVVSSVNGTTKSYFNEVTSVASSVLTTIQTYTVPLATTAYLKKIDVSGTNVAVYSIEINSVIQDKKRTYFGNSLNSVFDFSEDDSGLTLVAGDVVEVKVMHVRPMVGDFNSRVQIVEV